MSPALRFILLLLTLFVAAPSAIAADLTGQIRGVVTDDGGLAVPGVALTLTAPQLLGNRVVATDDDGRFRSSSLPVGTYSLEAVKPGFNTVVVNDIRVGLGSTVTLEVTMTVAATGDVMVIQEEAPIVDVEKVQTGLTLSAEQLRDIPTGGRDYQSAMSLAPGVVGGGNANIRGGMDTANQYYVDGVNTTDPLTNTFSTNMNYDAIEEIQVITGGMDAEYGRSLGGAVNIVTKSGGNDFEVLGYGLYSDRNFEIYTPLPGEEPAETPYTSQQYALNVGGPIIKDKLWFFTSLQRDIYRDSVILDPDFERPEGDDPVTPWEDEMSTVPARDWTSWYLFGKLTWQPTSTHRIWLHAQADPTVIENTMQDPYTLPSGETIQTQGGWLGSLGHIWMPSDVMNVETQLYYQRSYIDFYSILWKECQNFDERGACTDTFGDGQFAGASWWANDADGFSFGEFPYASFNVRNRMSVNSALTYYLTALGEHEFKIGVQAEQLQSYYIYPGLETGYAFYNHNGDPLDLTGYEPSLLYVYNNDLEVNLSGLMASAFIQDVWKPVPTLTIRPGARVDRTSLNNDLGDPIFSSINVSPRFGAAWDVMGDQKTNVHAYYGRFVDPGFLYIADLLKDKSEGLSGYGWDAEAGDWSTEPFVSYGDTFLKAPDLKTPYSDEFDLGMTRALSDTVSVDVTWTYEHARNFWEDDEVNLIWDDEGSKVIGYRNGENVAVFRLRTPDELYTKYNSIELTANAQLDYWWFQGSYTWAQAQGTSDDQGATVLLDIAQQMRYAEGYLSYDRPHAIKLLGTYRNAEKWTLGSQKAGYLLGWNFRMYSGTPYRKLYWNDYYAGWYNYADISDGTYRLPAFSQTDLRGGFMFGAGRTTWAITLDCFNVLNDRAVTSVNSTWGDSDGEGIYLNSDDEPVFGEPLSRQTPRRFQLGLRGEF